jgi:hypothetical protein
MQEILAVKSHIFYASALNGREWPLYSKANKLQYSLVCRLEGSYC